MPFTQTNVSHLQCRHSDHANLRRGSIGENVFLPTSIRLEHDSIRLDYHFRTATRPGTSDLPLHDSRNKSIGQAELVSSSLSAPYFTILYSSRKPVTA